ncbi:5-formyltetrahydrofolate cyclo-ligase [Pelagibacterium luteolum]|uniref:5-formyltetrahydrofolate cyclo-ligase n=1 Tax=Pelagibacterium luteolum TaxID=440168 RepID=A0A1G7ZCL5_9HYPH|nr:5-formyltetrahydrofolate cyclo-ligase [Pelagibacterium luteolum]SDH06327.1 5-formyltetrahydrofolate cyclo-ligase [Pelagibacterium luteolum]
MTDEEAQLEEQKARLREEAFARRTGVPQADRQDASKAAADHFLDGIALQKNQIVALYWPIRDEIDCKPLLTKLMDSGQPVALPVVLSEDEPLELRLWEDGQPLYPSGFGTLAPSETAPVVVPDIVVIPLLAFDKTGTRLGYGKGYYDRTLAHMGTRPLLVGYAFSAQELDFIPRLAHDLPLDVLVTEAGVRRFENA